MSNTEKKNDAPKKKNSFWKVLFKLRSVILAIPVAAGAVIMAIHNQAVLPSKVGFGLQASGDYAYMVSKSVAVLGPVAITAVCLLMTFCSRKVLYPWLISLFSLVLPIVIYLINTLQ